MNAFAMEYQIPVPLRFFYTSSFEVKHPVWKKICWHILYLQDGDIINIDVTVYLNVSFFFPRRGMMVADFDFVWWWELNSHEISFAIYLAYPRYNFFY